MAFPRADIIRFASNIVESMTLEIDGHGLDQQANSGISLSHQFPPEKIAALKAAGILRDAKLSELR